MMTRAKVLMLGMLAAFAVGAVASASASAAPLVWEVCLEEKITTTKYQDSKCSKEEAAGKFGWMPIEVTLNITATGGKQELALPGPGIKITCEKVKSAGNIKTGGKDEVTELKYEECKINIAGCEVVKSVGSKVKTTIEVPPPLKTELRSIEKGTALLVIDLFEGKEGKFVVLEIGKKENAKGEAEGACGVLPTKVEVSGMADGMPEGEALNFIGEGTLKAAGFAAEYRGNTTQKLENGKTFRASS